MFLHIVDGGGRGQVRPLSVQDFIRRNESGGEATARGALIKQKKTLFLKILDQLASYTGLMSVSHSLKSIWDCLQPCFLQFTWGSTSCGE